MARLRRPRAEVVEALLASRAAPTYAEVGATAGEAAALTAASWASAYDVDDHRFPLGRGRDRFERAGEALLAWRHFDVPWLELHGGEAQVHEGQVVASQVRIGGLWFLNPCRVVYVETPPDANHVAFGYGTLPGHAESGEERFEVAFDPVTEQVTYRMFAFSRPGLVLTRLGYPLARLVQRRFARAAATALGEAVASAG